MSNIDSRVTTGIFIGIFLAIFFAAGFLLNGFSNAGNPTGKIIESNGQDTSDTDNEEITSVQESDEETLSQSEALNKAKNYIAGQVPPFITNVTTVTVERDTNIEGTEYFYNWTAAFTVEPNSFGDWATNNTTQKFFNFYVSKNGDYLFYSAPEKTKTTQPEGMVYNGP